MTDIQNEHHDDVAAVASSTDAADGDAIGVAATEDEAADFVHPVDHGAGTEELPVEAEPAGSYVSTEHPPTAEKVVDDDEKGDYVTPVDSGDGSYTDLDGPSGDYVDPVDHR